MGVLDKLKELVAELEKDDKKDEEPKTEEKKEDPKPKQEPKQEKPAPKEEKKEETPTYTPDEVRKMIADEVAKYKPNSPIPTAEKKDVSAEKFNEDSIVKMSDDEINKAFEDNKSGMKEYISTLKSEN